MWKSLTEIELSILYEQCLKRRIGDANLLQSEIDKWQHQRNLEAAQVRWRFTTEDVSHRVTCIVFDKLCF